MSADTMLSTSQARVNSSQPSGVQHCHHSSFADEETDPERRSRRFKVPQLVRDGYKPTVQTQHNDSRIASLNHQHVAYNNTLAAL